MYIVGITGGIGSGKSILSNFFLKKNIPIYNSDLYAKIIMEHFLCIKVKIIKFFGIKSYINNRLNVKYLSNKIFNNKINLNIMNSIVHPYVFLHFKNWINSLYNFPYCIKETALLFESGLYKICNFIITITCPIKLKIKRIMKRNPTLSEDDIIKRIIIQWPDSIKINYSNIVINNILNINKLKSISEKIHNILLYNINQFK